MSLQQPRLLQKQVTVKSGAEGKYLGKYKAQCLILYSKSPKIPPALLSAPYSPFSCSAVCYCALLPIWWAIWSSPGEHLLCYPARGRWSKGRQGACVGPSAPSCSGSAPIAPLWFLMSHLLLQPPSGKTSMDQLGSQAHQPEYPPSQHLFTTALTLLGCLVLFPEQSHVPLHVQPSKLGREVCLRATGATEDRGWCCKPLAVIPCMCACVRMIFSEMWGLWLPGQDRVLSFH